MGEPLNRPTMPKLNLKQRLKDSITKIHLKQSAGKQQLKNSITKLQHKASAIKLRLSALKKPKIKESTSKKFAFPKINFSFKKKIPEPETPEPSKTLPKGIKVFDKYPLYEPFA